MLNVLRGFAFWLGMISSTIVITAGLIFTFMLPFRWRYRFASLWPTFNLRWLRITWNLKHRVEGMEHIPDKPVIIMSNHQSAWETLAIPHHLPPMVWVLKRELMWIPIFGWGLAVLRPIAINRSKGKRAMTQLLEVGQKRLDQGQNICIFPEGTRIAYGSKGRYRAGGAVLAEKTGTPILPIAHNAGYFWPRRAFHKHPGTITMRIGPPILTAGKSAQQILNEVEQWIESNKAQLQIEGASKA